MTVVSQRWKRFKIVIQRCWRIIHRGTQRVFSVNYLLSLLSRHLEVVGERRGTRGGQAGGEGALPPQNYGKNWKNLYRKNRVRNRGSFASEQYVLAIPKQSQSWIQHDWLTSRENEIILSCLLVVDFTSNDFLNCFNFLSFFFLVSVLLL